MNYQNQSGGNWSSRKALGIDENGQLLTNQGNTEMSFDVWKKLVDQWDNPRR